MSPDWIVRDACVADLQELTAIAFAEHSAVHRDRLKAAEDGCLRFLVAKQEDAVAGFGLLLSSLPPSWTGVQAKGLPMVVSLHVREDLRGKDVGTAILRQIEGHARQGGYCELFLRVDPVDNPRALTLHQRLGYHPLQSEPYWDVWQITDPDGFVHRGEEWALDLAKKLR